jgi:hypothetical protein
VFDDVVTIALQAVAGATYPLVMPKYTPDAVVKDITDGLTSGPSDLSAKNTEHYLTLILQPVSVSAVSGPGRPGSGRERGSREHRRARNARQRLDLGVEAELRRRQAARGAHSAVSGRAGSTLGSPSST